MKNQTLFLIFSILLWGCTQIDSDLSQSGEVSFKAVSISSFSGNMPNGRTEAASIWKHQFKNEAVLEVRDKMTGQVYKMDFNPNEFGEGFKLTLPFGTYTYFSEVKGGDYEKFLPFLIEGEFKLNSEKMYITLTATTDYGLITVKNEFIKSLGIRHGSDLCDFDLLEDDSHYFIYAKDGLIVDLEIVETVENKLIKSQVGVKEYNHYHFFLYMDQSNGNANFIGLALGAFEFIEEAIEIEGQEDTGIFTDPRDGKNYMTIQIGEQIWMAENLNYAPSSTGCSNINDDDSCSQNGSGYLYRDAVKACPEGWHLPSNEEWGELVNFLGGWEKAGENLKATSWITASGGSWWSSTLEIEEDEVHQSIETFYYFFFLGVLSNEVELILSDFEDDSTPCRCLKD